MRHPNSKTHTALNAASRLDLGATGILIAQTTGNHPDPFTQKESRMSYDEQYPEDTEESYYAEMDAALKPKTHTLALPEWLVKAILEGHCTRVSVPMEPQPAIVGHVRYRPSPPYTVGDRLVVRIREGDERPEEIFFAVTSISAGRVQDMTVEQMCMEGTPHPWEVYCKCDECRSLHMNTHANCWDAEHDNPAHKWSENPWVWHVNFEKETA